MNYNYQVCYEATGELVGKVYCSMGEAMDEADRLNSIANQTVYSVKKLD
jgi:hypothetical protein